MIGLVQTQFEVARNGRYAANSHGVAPRAFLAGGLHQDCSAPATVKCDRNKTACQHAFTTPCDFAARDEIRICMAAAKPKHWRKWSRQKRTCMLPTGCCVFVFEYGDMVTVLTKNQAGKRI